jgi:hypothetical protein
MISQEAFMHLTSGKALDIVVAEQVMGWQLEKDEERIKRLNGYLAYDAERRWWRMPTGGWYHKPPDYSSDIAAAWQVVEIMNRQEYRLHLIQSDFENDASFVRDGMNVNCIREKSVPEAICKAALQVISNLALEERRTDLEILSLISPQ